MYFEGPGRRKGALDDRRRDDVKEAAGRQWMRVARDREKWRLEELCHLIT